MLNQIVLILSIFFISFLGFWILTKSHLKPLTYFYIPAGKSATNARLLAGLPLALSAIFSQFFNALSLPYFYLISSWTICSLLIVCYGFWDDKYEIKAKTKLIFQILISTLFALFAASTINEVNSFISIPFLIFCALALMNGTNLLDGLDTMSIKLSTITFTTFAIIGLIFNASELIMPALIFITPLWAFYFYNKEPSKLHLGEIGGSFLGFSSLLLGIICFKELSPKIGQIKAVSLSTLPFVWPITELASSFIRRIYSGKSPFKGDRQHIHHILKEDFSLVPSLVTNILAGTNLLINIIGLLTSIIGHPLTGFVITASLQSIFYLFVCKHRWLSKKKEVLYWKILSEALRYKTPHYIPVTHVDNLRVFPKQNIKHRHN